MTAPAGAAGSPPRPSVRWLDVLARVSRRLTLAPDVDALSRVAVDAVAEALDLVAVSWWEPVEDGGRLRLVVVAGAASDQVGLIPHWSPRGGLMSRSLREARTVLVGDVRRDPDYVGTIAATRSELCVPVLDTAGAVVGLIDVQSRRPDEFTPTAVDVVEAIARQAAMVRDIAALDRGRALRLIEQEAVHHAALDILAARPYGETLADIVDRVLELCDADEGGIYVLEPDGLHLRLEHLRGSRAGAVGLRLRVGEGLAGLVAATAAPFLVADYSAWAGRSSSWADVPWRSVAGVPMMHAGAVLGVLDIMSVRRERLFDADDMRILELFAAPAALALQNARRAGEHVADLDAASLVARELSGVTDAAAARAAVCSTALAVVGSQVSLFWERTEDDGLVLASAAGCAVPPGLRQDPDAVTPSMQALLTNRAIFARSGDPVNSPALQVATGCTAVYAQPVVRSGRTVGVLVVGWPHRLHDPTVREASLMSLLADNAAAAMERADLVARLDRMARTDSLTTVPNRRTWEEELPRLLAAAAAAGDPLSIAMLDLDFFKLFNDVQGHQRGDLLLREVAGAWQSQLRDGDLLARYGGEEFAVALPGSSLHEALGIVDRLRSSTPAGQTSSAGLAEWDGTETAAALVARSDAALYDAKRSGRARSVASAGTAPPTAAASRPRRARTRRLGASGDLLAGGSVWAELQPIVRLSEWLRAEPPQGPAATGSVAGYAARLRVEGPLADWQKDDLLAAARHRGVGRELDGLFRRAAVAAVASAHLPVSAPVVIHIGIDLLLDPADEVDDLVALLQGTGLRPSTAVLAITEREAVPDMNRLVDAVATYRARGFPFAVDDVGDGHSTLEVLAAVMPDYIGLARGLTLDRTRGAQAAVQAVVAFAEATGARVVAAGLASRDQAASMRDMGVELGRGRTFAAAHP